MFGQAVGFETVFGEALGNKDSPILGNRRLQSLAARREWLFAQVFSILVKQIEYCVRSRAALLEQLKTRDTVAVEGYGFAIQQKGSGRKFADRSSDLGIAVGAVVVIS